MKNSIRFDLNANREITTIDFKENIVVFKDVLFIGDEKYSSSTGFCYKEELEVLKEDSMAKITSRLDKVYLMSKEVENLHLTHKIDTKYFEKFHSLEITSPFDFISENPDKLDSFDLYSFSNSDHHLRDKHGDTLPRAIYFNYMSSNGAITDKYYNLPDLKNFLSKNTRILFLSDKILDIPYFSCEHDEHKFLSFIWMPTKDNHDELSKLHPFVKHEKIKEILGLEKFSK